MFKRSVGKEVVGILMECFLVTARSGKVMFLQLSVILFTGPMSG